MAKDRSPSQIERDRTLVSRYYLQGKTQPEIAKLVEISQSTVSRDIKVLEEEWQTERVYNINEAKARELARVDILELEYWEGYERSKLDAITRTRTLKELPAGSEQVGGDKLNKKKPKKGGTQQELQEVIKGQTGDPRFLQGIAWCINKRCEILGVDAPKKIEGNLGGEILFTRKKIGVDLDKI